MPSAAVDLLARRSDWRNIRKVQSGTWAMMLAGLELSRGLVSEHCVRAIRNGLKFGEHGLPLMATGDWNDGMNLVRAQGKGESVWLHVMDRAIEPLLPPRSR